MRRLFRHWLTKALLLTLLVCGISAARVVYAANPCSETLGFGKVDNLSVNIGLSDGGTYRVWSRMQIPTANATYKIEIDGDCYDVAGGTTVNQWVWNGNKTNGTPLSLPLSPGTHQVRLFGTSEGVLLDRIIFTKNPSLDCNPPSDKGDICVDKVEDTQPPTVSISTPVSGSTISSGSAILTASASDVGGSVTKVEYYLNGVPNAPVKIGEATSAPYSVNWNTSALANGSYTVTAKAYDNATPVNVGNTTLATSVTIANGQPNLKVTSLAISPTSPKVNDVVTVTATIQNSGTVATPSGFTVGFKVGTTALTNAVTSGTLGANATTTVTSTWTPTSGGTYSLTAEADSAKVITESNEADNITNPALSVAVSSPDVTAPTVSITAPLNNATNLNGAVNIVASASDNSGGSGMQKVVFLIDNAQVGQVTSTSSATHTYSWDTTKVSNAIHKISVVAYDKAGNVSTPVNINVTVANPLPPQPKDGDLNEDGVVNYNDLLPVVNHYGFTGQSKINGNADGDPGGNVTYADLMMVINNWTL